MQSRKSSSTEPSLSREVIYTVSGGVGMVLALYGFLNSPEILDANISAASVMFAATMMGGAAVGVGVTFVAEQVVKNADSCIKHTHSCIKNTSSFWKHKQETEIAHIQPIEKDCVNRDQSRLR